MKTIIVLVILFLFGCSSDNGQPRSRRLPQFRLFELRFCSGEIDTVGAFSWEIISLVGDDCANLEFGHSIDHVTGRTTKSVIIDSVESVKEIYR